MVIDRFYELPDLLEQYMEENGSDERGVTMQESWYHLNLNEENGHIIAGFLCGLRYKPIFKFLSLFTVSKGFKLNTAHRSHPTGIW